MYKIRPLKVVRVVAKAPISSKEDEIVLMRKAMGKALEKPMRKSLEKPKSTDDGEATEAFPETHDNKTSNRKNPRKGRNETRGGYAGKCRRVEDSESVDSNEEEQEYIDSDDEDLSKEDNREGDKECASMSGQEKKQEDQEKNRGKSRTEKTCNYKIKEEVMTTCDEDSQSMNVTVKLNFGKDRKHRRK